MGRIRCIVFLFVVTSLVSGCAHCPPVDPQHKLFAQFDDYMIPLAKAVDVVIDRLPPDAKDDVIFQEVVKRTGNPDILKPFAGYVLRARIDNGFGVVLLCSPDGKEGIIEDAACTTWPDSFRPTGSPCEYFLDLKRVCSTP
jgi:hypothetical protein